MDERGSATLVSAFEKGDVEFLGKLKALAGDDIRRKSLVRIDDRHSANAQNTKPESKESVLPECKSAESSDLSSLLIS